MPHENADDSEEAVNAEKRLFAAYYQVKDLMPEAINRQALKKAANKAKTTQDNHPILTVLAEVFLVIVTLGIVKHLRNKSS